MATIVFNGTPYPAEVGRDVLGSLIDADAPINYICLSGACGTCRVQVCKGADQLTPLQPVERRHFPEADGSVRLACQAVVLGNGEIEIRQ